ncbi:MAG: hypothetical protein ABI441_03780 [Flavobacterium sp.]
MITQKKINKSWASIGYLPEKTDKFGFVPFESLPEDFDIGNLDAKHLLESSGLRNRKTIVRPKSLSNPNWWNKLYRWLVFKKKTL